MCGIVGWVDRDLPADAERIVSRAAAALNHRGPDDSGIYKDNSACLAFRRLSIIDVEGGAQPMGNEDGTIQVVFNGEIYNFRELRRDLEAKGHVFSSSADTEVIVHLYEERGDACVEELHGMFAFALWDSRRKRLLIARDRLGIKPLYYAPRPGGLAFASEPKALLRMPGVGREVSDSALHAFLAFRYVPDELCIFDDIRKLLPGHYITWEAGQIGEPRCYWDLEFTPEQAGTDDELIHEFGERFRSAVASHLVSDVPLGVLLSGGLDSTAVVSAMRDSGAAGRIKTFSVAFDSGGEYDERAYARAASEAFDTDHHEVVIGARAYCDLFDELSETLDEPLADLATIPLFAVSRLARQHVTVVLSGEGSDELFGGYPGIERHVAAADRLASIPLAARRMSAGILSALSSRVGSAWSAAIAGRPTEFARNRRISMTRVFDEASARSILSNPLLPGASSPDDRLMAMYDRTETADPLNQILYGYCKQWLPEDLLAKADRATMANSLELRVPFLDDGLVAFTARLPRRLKIRKENGSWRRKYALTRAMEGRVPDGILHREKRGFPVPAYGWLTGQLREFATDRLLVRQNPIAYRFRKPAIEDLLSESAAGSSLAQRRVWSLLALYNWAERYLK